jgi:hypothetical protein
MLLAHRKMTDADIIQMNRMRNVGISTPHIYQTFASQAGGYHNVGFRKRDIYNQISRQHKQESNDAKAAIAYLRELKKNEPLMFWSYNIDNEGRLQNLFWADGSSRLNYEVFGDVLAFDATYNKIKYILPVVFFSGVNHHNQTIVFAAAIVTNETEQTYVWLLEQFMEAMKGKAPTSVITDGDLAMRNAIRRIFPHTHHRLCLALDEERH